MLTGLEWYVCELLNKCHNLNMIELFISFRYLWSRKQNGFVSFVTAISLMGITLGVAALIIILSVMNGFEYELRERLLSMSAHGHITNHNNDIGDWPTETRR